MPVPAGYPRDFFISRAGADAPWAEWIAWVLEEEGYTTHLQDWDFGAGKSFVRSMQEGAAHCARTIAVLSPDYFGSDFTTMEWEAALTGDPAGQKRALVTVRVRPCEIPGLLTRYPYIDLVGKAENDARSELLRCLDRSRKKPLAAPPFPGVAGGSPDFPGPSPSTRSESGRSTPGSSRNVAARPPEPGLAPIAEARARSLLPARAQGTGLLVVCLGSAPAIQVIRPAVLAGSDFSDRVLFAAMKANPPILDTKETECKTANGMLTVQQRDATVSVAADASMRVTMLAYDVKGASSMGEMAGLIEEDVAERIGRVLRFLAELLTSIDSAALVTTLAPAAAVYGAMTLGWRTQSERDAQRGRGMHINPLKGEGVARLPGMDRQAFIRGIDDVTTDLTALLAEQLRP